MSDERIKVAVVDDDYTTRTLVVDFLEDRQCDVIWSEDPDKLPEIGNCQVLIMDVMIKKNRYAGIDYIIELKQKGKLNPDTLVVFISNFGRESDEIKTRLAQIEKFVWLDKPINWARFAKIIRQVA